MGSDPNTSGDVATPSRPLRLKLWVQVLLWLAFLPVLAVVLWGQLFPHTFKETGAIPVGLAWSAFIARTFTFHIGLALLPLLLIAILVRARKLCVLIVLLCVFCVSGSAWTLRPKNPVPIAGTPLRVATCNVLGKNRSYDEYLQELATQDVDLVVFQEANETWSKHIQATLGSSHPHEVSVPRGGYTTIVIRSRTPLHNVSTVYEDESGFSGVLRCEIEHDGQRMAVYGVHLMVPLSRAYLRRGRLQFAALAEVLAKETLPVIVLGDFNSPTESAQLDRLRSLGFCDAWDIAGRGRGGTWPNHAGVFSLLPTRIDHIMLSQAFTCTDVALGHGAGSDHRPVYATIGFASR
ncbi:MAG: endonuclease/exonuclease/phosphatase family protein [Phycisphaeraceae bacterium]|nr:endonuclease/exonuclease/phosphatase family protein [Phycisphaerales bacterium]MCB9859453.1 endonuclease/exonuclease/phosphatase family protein [Phycisphaeraceae bacterium]